MNRTSKTATAASGHSSVCTNAEHSALNGEYVSETNKNENSHQQLLELRHRLPSVIDNQAIRVHRRCPPELQMTREGGNRQQNNIKQKQNGHRHAIYTWKMSATPKYKHLLKHQKRLK